MYQQLDSLKNLRIFMKYHVFAVWDFMSLLKSLQGTLTGLSIPWQESSFDPALVQLINEIVLIEESDQDQTGAAISHFSLYLRGMQEIDADDGLIRNFILEKDYSLLPGPLKDIVEYHLDLAMHGEIHEVASSFFYGREKLIPDMFTSIVDVLEKSATASPSLLYYLKRHIQVDGDEHGPKALLCLHKLTDTLQKSERAMSVAQESLQKRCQLWDFIEAEIKSNA